MYTLTIAIFMFLLGFYICINFTRDDVIESFSGNSCPNMLIQKGILYTLGTYLVQQIKELILVYFSKIIFQEI